MASEEDPTVYGEEEEDEDDESFEEDVTLTNSRHHHHHHHHHPPHEDDEDSTSSSNLATVTIAVAGQAIADPDPKVSIASVVEEKKPSGLDESRRLFQRLWTDEDEIELLQGFLDYTVLRGTNNSSHHHDTTAFYDQIKCKLQLDFNKNQLVEKLRRLKKKYRNVLSKIASGKEYVFKSPHDQATFDISRKIWTETQSGPATVVAVEETGFDDALPLPLFNDDADSDKKLPRSRKRSRVKIEDKNTFHQPPTPTLTPTPSMSIPNLVEDTLKTCLSPLFKELIHNAMNTNNNNVPRAFTINPPMPFTFGASPSINFTAGDMLDHKWRKQYILELEVYSKRLELVQDQVKSQLEELRSMDN